MFVNYVLAGYPLLWAETFEEHRAVVDFCQQMDKSKEKYTIYTWDRIDGIRRVALQSGNLGTSVPEDATSDPLDALNWAEKKAPNNSIVLLKDYHHYVKKDFIVRKIRNLIPIFKSAGKVLVIMSPGVDIPPEIEKEITVIPFKLPGRDELKVVLRGVCESASSKEVKVPYPKDDALLIDSALGMTAFEAENAYSISMVEAKKFDPIIVQREKAAIVRKTGLLEVVDSPYNLKDIGGLENLKEWLGARKDCFTEDAKAFGLTPPKGLMLVGIPGTGKSLSAKAAAKALNRPLLKLEVGKIFGSYVGESESNLRKCLAIAEACAPVLLYIDEFEKFFGDSDGESAHEVTKRVLGAMLSWMSDKTADVFIVATANKVESIPPAMLRSGRFDAIFWVDLPDEKQRKEIIQIHLNKIGRNPKDFDIPLLAKETAEFSGAEIETWIKEGLTTAYGLPAKKLTDKILIGSIGEITPVAKLMGDGLQKARDWATTHKAKNASKSSSEPVLETKRQIKL